MGALELLVAQSMYDVSVNFLRRTTVIQAPKPEQKAADCISRGNNAHFPHRPTLVNKFCVSLDVQSIGQCEEQPETASLVGSDCRAMMNSIGCREVTAEMDLKGFP